MTNLLITVNIALLLGCGVHFAMTKNSSTLVQVESIQKREIVSIESNTLSKCPSNKYLLHKTIGPICVFKGEY